jgi:hypothetical protein
MELEKTFLAMDNNNQVHKLNKMFVPVNFDIFQLNKINKMFVLTNSDIFQFHMELEKTFPAMDNKNQVDKDIGLIL